MVIVITGFVYVTDISGHNDSSAEVKMYHGVCLKVLDVVYMWRRDIYKKLFQLATGRFETSTKERCIKKSVEMETLQGHSPEK